MEFINEMTFLIEVYKYIVTPVASNYDLAFFLSGK